MSMDQRTRKGRRKAGRQQRRASLWGQWWLYAIVPALVIVVLGVGVSAIQRGGNSSPAAPQGIAFPAYVRQSPSDIKAAYAYAVEHPDMLQYIPCFCGCVQHAGHTSVHDCFVQKRHIQDGIVVFDDHGAGCQMCADIALDAKRLIAQGKSLQEARSYVEAKYSSIGPSTNTPPPPGA